MGYDVDRFASSVDEELICIICKGVFENPVQVSECEHAFCRACILEWLSARRICPVDRNRILVSSLKSVPRILKNLLSKLEIRCDNVDYGCEQVLKLELLKDHLAICEFNPKRPVVCDNCELIVPQDEMQDHSCVRQLRNLYDQCLDRISNLESELRSLRNEISTDTDNRGSALASAAAAAAFLGLPSYNNSSASERAFQIISSSAPLVNTSTSDDNNNTNNNTLGINNNNSNAGLTDNNLLNSAFDSIRMVGGGTSGGIATAAAAAAAAEIFQSGGYSISSRSPRQPSPITTNQVGLTDELLRWINTLSVARVTRWGGMISTPDMVLQGVIRRALVDSGCPHRILQQLMINAHERSWPPGLQNLETRQSNRIYYESYILRRIPSRQAVVVMAADNRHMEGDMICEPGLVMIFAHGVH